MTQQSPTQNQPPKHRSSIILWIGIALLLVIAFLGTYAIVARQNIVFSVISFGLALSAIPIGILQVAPNLLSQARRTVKIGLPVIGILLLVVSLGINVILIKDQNGPTPSPAFVSTPTMTPTLAHLTSTPTMTPTPTSTPPSAPILVQKGFQDQHASSIAVTFPSGVTSGNLIIAAITQFRGIISSVTDNHHNTYNQVIAVQHANASTDYVQLYYAKNVIGGTTTITVIFSIAGDKNMGVYEYSGLDQISPLDQVVSNAGYGNTPNGATLTTTTDNELYFAVGVDDNGNNSAPSAGNGYNLEDHQDDSSTHERFYTEDRISAHGSYQTNFSIATASNWAVIGASFKSVGSPTSILTPVSTLPAHSSVVIYQVDLWNSWKQRR